MCLFSDTIKKIKLTTEGDCFKLVELIKRFSFGDCPTKKDYERFSCCIYIISIFKLNRIQFPFSASWTEPPCPDFILNIMGKPVGLEQTNATTNSYKHAEAIGANYPEGSCLELSEYCSNETSRDTAELGLRKPDEPLQGSGWGDYGQEKLWARCFYDSIVRKTKRLNSHYITQCPNHELIIYDYTPTCAPRLGYAMKKLKIQYHQFIDDEKRDGTLFDKTHVISGNRFYYDLMGEELDCDIPRESL